MIFKLGRSAVCLPDFFFSPALPTTPVSLPYGTAVTTSYSGTGPPIRTLTQQPINVQTHRDHDQIQSNSLHPSVTSNMLQQRAPSNHQQTFPIRTVSFLFNFPDFFLNFAQSFSINLYDTMHF